MKNISCMYFDFNYLKQKFNLPKDALFKNIEVNNKTGEIEIYYYTNESSNKVIPINEDMYTIRYRPE